VARIINLYNWNNCAQKVWRGGEAALGSNGASLERNLSLTARGRRCTVVGFLSRARCHRKSIGQGSRRKASSSNKHASLNNTLVCDNLVLKILFWDENIIENNTLICE
jgi:hypothetical protein